MKELIIVETVEALTELAGCSTDEAENIAEFFDNAVNEEVLFDYYIIDGGVELVKPEEDFVEEFKKFLTKRLGYRPEIYWKNSAVEVVF